MQAYISIYKLLPHRNALSRECAQIQEEQERSRAAAAKHDSALEQLSAERAHILELDSQIESQHNVCYQSLHAPCVPF